MHNITNERYFLAANAAGALVGQPLSATVTLHAKLLILVATNLEWELGERARSDDKHRSNIQPKRGLRSSGESRLVNHSGAQLRLRASCRCPNSSMNNRKRGSASVSCKGEGGA